MDLTSDGPGGAGDFAAGELGVQAAAAKLGLTTKGLKVLIRAGLLPGPARNGFAQAALDAAWVSAAQRAMSGGHAVFRATLLAAGIALPASLRARTSVPVTPSMPGVRDAG